MRVLLTAPYVGEIGWELMSWQARVRWYFRQGRFDRLVVLGAAGKSAFYEDMPLDYRHVNLSELPGEAYEDRRIVKGSSEPVSAGLIRDALMPIVQSHVDELAAQQCDVEVLWPDYAGTIYPCERGYQEFIRFHRDLTEPVASPWVVLVQRSRSMGAMNWSVQQWQELNERLMRRGIHTSVYPCESASAIAVAGHADLAVGQSTGGLHLASLCGCPQVVWSVGQTHLWTPWEMTNRQRYETFWNPLGTPVAFHETETLPSVDQAAEWIIVAVQRIGRRTGSAMTRAGFHRRWRLKGWLVRHVIRRPEFQQWPWPVQRFVRYQLV